MANELDDITYIAVLPEVYTHTYNYSPFLLPTIPKSFLTLLFLFLFSSVPFFPFYFPLPYSCCSAAFVCLAATAPRSIIIYIYIKYLSNSRSLGRRYIPKYYYLFSYIYVYTITSCHDDDISPVFSPRV